MSGPLNLAVREAGSTLSPEVVRNPVAARARAALVNPPDPSSADNFRLVPPLGLGYMASYARRFGHHVDVFDFSLDLDPSTDWLTEVGFFDAYDVYGFTTYSDNFLSTAEIARRTKAAAPNAVIVMGGYHAGLLDREVLDDFPFVDLVVRKEGEAAFRGILDAVAGACLPAAAAHIPGVTWRGPNGAVVRNPDPDEWVDQAALPLPAADLRYRPAKYRTFWHARAGRAKRTLNVVGSRGCPKRCTFCSIITLNPVWRARSVESLMGEIALRYAQCPFEHVAFQDANCFVNPKRTLEFARALKAFNPEVTWSGTATPDHVVRHAGVIEELATLNCAFLELGIESGNDNSLARFGKGTTVEINETALALLDRAGITLGLDFIMFDPEMSFDDLRENYAFLCRNDLGGEWPAEFLFQELQLYPGTRMRSRLAADRGLVFEPHRVPHTPFFDARVGAAFRVMSAYRRDVQAATNQAIKEIYGVTNPLLSPGHRAGCERLGLGGPIQQLLVLLVRLRHQPFEFFRHLLFESGHEAPLARDPDTRHPPDGGAEDLVTRARSLAASLRRRLRSEGVELPEDQLRAAPQHLIPEGAARDPASPHPE